MFISVYFYCFMQKKKKGINKKNKNIDFFKKLDLQMYKYRWAKIKYENF
jgi:hypothetical protein